METLFDSACRYMSDSELIYEITNNKKIVTETEQQSGEYDLNGLFSSLTQKGGYGCHRTVQAAAKQV